MNLQQAIEQNWSEESSAYSQSVREDLDTEKRTAWTNLILQYAPSKEHLDFLDIGTGPGFFPIILTKAGHHVTGIDCVEDMLLEAKRNAEAEQVSPTFRLADSHALPFPDNHFDCVISRNVTWTLIDAEQSYREWLRVLRPGGKILIFDANWNLRYHVPELMRQYQEDQKRFAEIFHKQPDTLSPEAEAYRRNVPMCKHYRPNWDFDTFLKIGVKKIFCDADITDLCVGYRSESTVSFYADVFTGGRKAVLK